MKCKYCGYEYSKGVIKFCPNCGSSLINNEGNGFELKKEADVVREKSNDGNVSKEEVAATAATIPEKDGNIIKRFWRKFYQSGYRDRKYKEKRGVDYADTGTE